MSFDKYIHPGIHQAITIQNISATPNISLGPLPKQSPLQRNHCSDFCVCKLVLSVCDLHVSGIVQYVLFCAWLHLFSIRTNEVSEIYPCCSL